LELQAYVPVGLSIALALAFCGLFVALAVFIGPQRVTPVKLGPFECGMDPIGSPRARYSVKFYQVAILFLVFDIEAAFMYPWAVLYRKPAGFDPETCALGSSTYNDLQCFALSGYSVDTPGGVAAAQISGFGFVEMLLFVIVLVVALAYVWRKKAIGWD
jgi:NADH-quinone oxidoreductase subunit A